MGVSQVHAPASMGEQDEDTHRRQLSAQQLERHGLSSCMAPTHMLRTTSTLHAACCRNSCPCVVDSEGTLPRSKPNNSGCGTTITVHMDDSTRSRVPACEQGNKDAGQPNHHSRTRGRVRPELLKGKRARRAPCIAGTNEAPQHRYAQAAGTHSSTCRRHPRHPLPPHQVQISRVDERRCAKLPSPGAPSTTPCA